MAPTKPNRFKGPPKSSVNNFPSPKNSWLLTQEAFDLLLDWLGPEREQAGQKYESIRNVLIKIFQARGWAIAEDLADETINRVAHKVSELRQNYVGDPAYYFAGVAQRIHLEYLKKSTRPLPVLLPPPPVVSESSPEADCLDHCLEKLPPQNRALVLEYYQEDKQAKIECRQRLAERLGIGLNALRLRAHRIRADLEKCVLNCVTERAGT